MAKKTVTSYGIACVNFNKQLQKYEILLIEKRCTYSFIFFVCGSYNLKNTKTLQKMFNEMTYSEKNMILSKKFDFIYYHAFMVGPTDLNTAFDTIMYESRKIVYEKFLQSEQVKLLNGSLNGSLIWEFPKGRKTESENDLDCAVREFEEETGFHSDNYVLLNGMQHIVKFTDIGCRFVYILYIAIYIGENNTIPYNASYSHNYEINNIKWVASDQVCNYLNTNLISAFKKIIKTVKNHKHIIYDNARTVNEDFRKSEIKIDV